MNELRESLLREAPLLSYGSHLDHWGESEISIGHSNLSDVHHRFLGASRDDNAPIPLSLFPLSKLQLSYYIPPPSLPSAICGAVTTHGGRCQRRDLTECPFHGMIIPRDSDGLPLTTTLPVSPHYTSPLPSSLPINSYTRKHTNTVPHQQQRSIAHPAPTSLTERPRLRKQLKDRLRKASVQIPVANSTLTKKKKK